MAQTQKRRTLVVQVAALDYRIAVLYPELFKRTGLEFRLLTPVFPAVTCAAQATFRTGLPPSQHGMVCNGIYNRTLCRTFFWEQSAALIGEKRIWSAFREKGGTVGELFWQQSLGEPIEMLLSPAPIHRHHGGMIQDCYARPRGLYEALCRKIGRKFNLRHYWGPLASAKSTEWITQATLAVMARADCPDLLLTYLPHLDYGLQKRGPDDVDRLREEVTVVVDCLRRLCEAARGHGRELVIWGDYGISPVWNPIQVNRILYEARLFKTRQVGKMLYPDLYSSRAVALADHQVAHVYVRDPRDLPLAAKVLTGTPGIEVVAEKPAGAHANNGELVLMSTAESWFSYKWWKSRDEAPEYATHVDIHSKIGFDPCELFFGWPPMSISLDDDRVMGSHGRPDVPVAFASTIGELETAMDLVELSQAFEEYLSA